MIDREHRDLLGEKLRQLISGAISNQEYDNMELDGKFDSDDPAILRVFRESWFLYDDFSEHEIKLSKEDKSTIARWILFLLNDYEYQWKEYRPWYLFLQQILLVCSFFSLSGYFQRVAAQFYAKQGGDYSVWPFFSKADYCFALENPKLLTKKA